MNHKKYVELYLSLKSDNTKKTYRRIWQEWIDHAGDKPSRWSLECASDFLAKVKAKPSQAGRSRLVSPRVSNATVYHKATVLSGILEALINYDVIKANPFKKLKGSLSGTQGGDRRPHSAIPADKVKLLIALPHNNREGVRDSALLAVLFGCALRRSEVMGLRLCDLCYTEHGSPYLRLVSTKSGIAQHVALADWVNERMQKLITQRQAEGAVSDSPIFVTYRDFRFGGTEPIGSSSIYRIFKYYCKAAGLGDDITPHCARATAITHLLNQGVSHRDICHFSRHGSVQMVERYDKRRLTVEESPGKKISYE